MNTSEVIRTLGIPINKLHYMEQKGDINPKQTLMGDRNTLEYSDQDVKEIRLIWKYLKTGLKHKNAHIKALEELSLINQKCDLHALILDGVTATWIV